MATFTTARARGLSHRLTCNTGIIRDGTHQMRVIQRGARPLIFSLGCVSGRPCVSLITSTGNTALSPSLPRTERPSEKTWRLIAARLANSLTSPRRRVPGLSFLLETEGHEDRRSRRQDTFPIPGNGNSALPRLAAMQHLVTQVDVESCPSDRVVPRPPSVVVNVPPTQSPCPLFICVTHFLLY